MVGVKSCRYMDFLVVYRISLNKSLPRINAGSVYMPGVNWAAKLINAGSQIDAGGVARTCVHTFERDDLWPRAFYSAPRHKLPKI